MLCANLRNGWLEKAGRHRQSGQALIYGLFMLTAGLAALFFLFNVSQLTREKTKLVNTSDAVAYSAGIMHARAMNFAAYTNRALVADEVAIAQMVSLSSWGKYLVEHGQSALALGCDPELYFGLVSEPVAEMMLRYIPVCEALGYATTIDALAPMNNSIQVLGQAAVMASELSKKALKLSQITMMGGLVPARLAVMQDVANANYVGDGEVDVDLAPLRDTYSVFHGNPIIHYYPDDERTRMRDLVVKVVNKDGFTPSRNWSASATIPEASCLLLGPYFNHVDRTGGTQLIGFDEWRAADQASYFRWHLNVSKWLPIPTCQQSEQVLGQGSQSAVQEGGAGGSGGGFSSSDDWNYSGIPTYAELSAEALKDPDPRVQFAIRVRRENTQTRTSDARSDIKTTARLNAYNNAVPVDAISKDRVYIGLSASETFFQRPVGRSDGNKELASLFNPYWQTHLMEVPAGVRAAAQASQGAVTP